MKKILAIASLLIAFAGGNTITHAQDMQCPAIEGNVLIVCELQRHITDWVDIASLQSQLEEVGMQLPSARVVEELVSGERSQLERTVSVTGVFPPTYDRLTATVSYTDDGWNVRVDTRTHLNVMIAIVMIVLALLAIISLSFAKRRSLIPTPTAITIIGMAVLLVPVFWLNQSTTQYSPLGMVMPGVLLGGIFSLLVITKQNKEDMSALLVGMIYGGVTGLIMAEHGLSGPVTVQWYIFSALLILIQYAWMYLTRSRKRKKRAPA